METGSLTSIPPLRVLVTFSARKAFVNMCTAFFSMYFCTMRDPYLTVVRLDEGMPGGPWCWLLTSISIGVKYKVYLETMNCTFHMQHWNFSWGTMKWKLSIWYSVWFSSNLTNILFHLTIAEASLVPSQNI